MNSDKKTGYLPAWTLLVPIAWCIATLAIVWACKAAGVLWEIGMPAGIASVVVSVVLERTIERKLGKKTRDVGLP